MTARPPRAPRPAMLTVAQAADKLGVDRTEVYHWIRSGLLASVRYPTRDGQRAGPLRVEEAAVEAFIQAHRQPATA